jgi:hypothetical protein
VFFYNIGGTGKVPQFVIAALTGILFLVGPQIINLVPRIIGLSIFPSSLPPFCASFSAPVSSLLAGVIMLHLAFDLLNDSTIASRRALDSLEYTSVILVGMIVTAFGFVPGPPLSLYSPLDTSRCIGIIAGGVSACVTFVVQSSKGSHVRGVFTGEVVRSNTSWTGRYRDKLEQGLATHGVYVIQLQGHIFFGNIQQIVKTIEEIIQEGYKKENTIGSSPYTSPRVHSGPKGYSPFPATLSFPDILTPCATPLHRTSTAGGSSTTSSPLIRPTSISPEFEEEENSSPPLAPQRSDPAPEYVVLDCSFVSGLDGNAVDGLLKLQVLPPYSCPLSYTDLCRGSYHLMTMNLIQSSSLSLDSKLLSKTCSLSIWQSSLRGTCTPPLFPLPLPLSCPFLVVSQEHNRFGTTPENDDFLSTFEPSERTRLLSISSSDEEKGITLNLHPTASAAAGGLGGGYQAINGSSGGGFRDMNETVAQEILKRKALPKPKYRRMKRSVDLSLATHPPPLSLSLIS